MELCQVYNNYSTAPRAHRPGFCRRSGTSARTSECKSGSRRSDLSVERRMRLCSTSWDSSPKSQVTCRRVRSARLAGSPTAPPRESLKVPLAELERLGCVNGRRKCQGLSAALGRERSDRQTPAGPPGGALEQLRLTDHACFVVSLAVGSNLRDHRCWPRTGVTPIVPDHPTGSRTHEVDTGFRRPG